MIVGCRDSRPAGELTKDTTRLGVVDGSYIHARREYYEKFSRMASQNPNEERQEDRTQCSLSRGRFIVVLWFIVAMVNRLGQLDRLAGMELVLARLVALGFFGKESHSARLGA